MKNFLNKLLLTLVVLSSTLFFAQGPPTPPPTGQAGVTPGAPATTPIDMYIVYLAVTAGAMIVYYTAKKRKQTV